VDQLADLRPSIALSPGMERVRNAVLEMVLEDFLFDLVERRPHGSHLVDDIDAVPVLLDHASHTAHLSFNSAEPSKLGFLDCGVHT
jgi:hypothetical protein